MTVSVNDAVDDYLAVGGETSFSYTFPVNTVVSPALHALVVETRLAGVLTTLVEGVDYTVTGAGNPLGGTALLDTGVFPAGAIAGVSWKLKRLNPLSRVTDFQTSGDFFATEVNLQLDLLTQIVQDQNRDVDANFDNSIRLADGSIFALGSMVDPITGTFLRAVAGGGFDWVTVAVTGTSVSVDETDTDATKDKLVSNLLAKDWEDAKDDYDTDWKDKLTTKGDLLAFSTLNIRLAIGTEGQRLNPNSSPAIGLEWSNQTPTLAKSTTYPVVAADQGKLLTLSGASFTVTLLAAATAGDGFKIGFKYGGTEGTDVYTIDGNAAETIDGAANQTLNFSNEILWIVCDGTNWKIINAKSLLTLSTKQTASGTAIDFTGIPAGVKRITISFQGVSLSGTDQILVQIGDSVGIEATGYISSGWTVAGGVVTSSTIGFLIRLGGAGDILSGIMILTRMDGAHLWVSSHTAKITTAFIVAGGGDKTLSAELTQLRVTRTGSDTFDAGSINIMFE